MTDTAISFDAIAAASALRAEGVEPGQADAMAQGMNQASAAAVVDAVNIFRAEMRQLRADIHKDMELLRADFYKEMALLQRNVIATTAGFVAIAVAAIGIML